MNQIKDNNIDLAKNRILFTSDLGCIEKHSAKIHLKVNNVPSFRKG